MGKHARYNEINILNQIIILLAIGLICLGIGAICRSMRITELEKQVNNLKFEKEYLEFVERDNKEQSK